jgi:hypothetical protein
MDQRCAQRFRPAMPRENLAERCLNAFVCYCKSVPLSDRAMELNDLIEAFFVIAFLASAILLALGLWRRRK